MKLIDTHTHLYLEAFDKDRLAVVENAVTDGIAKMLLPNIDATTISPMMNLCKQFPGVCFPMMGLHPGSVNGDYQAVLQETRSWFDKDSFIAVGEVGIDLYRDQTFKNEQIEAFREQVSWSLELDLPLVIHSRDSFSEIIKVLKTFSGAPLSGVFHSFTGSIEQAFQVLELGFYIGVNGIATFKNTHLGEVVRKLEMHHVVLETDAPYLAPAPCRGQRNESRYLVSIATKIAELTGCNLMDIAKSTTKNAHNIFRLKQ